MRASSLFAHMEGMELLHRLNQAHLDHRSTAEPLREHVMGPDGVARTHRRESCKRDLETRGGSFDEAIAHLVRASGGRMEKRQAEEVAVELSQDFDAFYSQPFESVKDERHEDNIPSYRPDH